MTNKRCMQTLNRLYKSILHPNPSSSSSFLRSFKTLSSYVSHSDLVPLSNFSLNPKYHQFFSTPNLNASTSHLTVSRHFSSRRRDDSDADDEMEEDDDDYVDDEDDDDDDDDDDSDEEMGDDDVANSVAERKYSLEEKEREAAEIGYKVIGQLQRGDRVFKKYEPVFAVIQIGSHQFKVSNGDCIFTEKLKFCEVNDKIILNKVLMLGSKTQTMLGRPILPDAAVHAVVEEHALDAKVIVFKKKRRKNYRRTRGHRQELTKLRITDIQGIEKPELPRPAKTKKASAKKVEKVAVAA